MRPLRPSGAGRRGGSLRLGRPDDERPARPARLPDCLTADERAQVGERHGASLWEVASARRVDRAALTRLATTNRARGAPAPADDWLGALAPGAEHVGLMAAEPEPDSGELLCMWAGRTKDGRHVGTLFPVPIADWMGLEEVYVPYALQAWARQMAAAA